LKFQRFTPSGCKDIGTLKFLCVSGKRDLLEYQIQDERLFIDNSNEGSRAEVKVVFRRSEFINY